MRKYFSVSFRNYSRDAFNNFPCNSLRNIYHLETSSMGFLLHVFFQKFLLKSAEVSIRNSCSGFLQKFLRRFFLEIHLSLFFQIFSKFIQRFSWVLPSIPSSNTFRILLWIRLKNRRKSTHQFFKTSSTGFFRNSFKKYTKDLPKKLL